MADTAQRIAALLGCGSVTLSPMAGGDLSSVHAVRTDDGRDVIAKQGGAAVVEARMLRAIGASGAPAPEVLYAEDDLLIISRCPSGGGRGGWASLADVLDTLHASEGERYGWPDDYAFGAVAIANAEHADWAAFWSEHRLACHIPHVSIALGDRLEKLVADIAGLLPADPPPSLLHGDLWGGNILFDGGRVSALIDPACYYGDREVDIAMLTLFDRPPRDFFARLALRQGWERRQPLYRLWPLLVHLRLFGSAYAGQVDSELQTLGY
ncbi:fructosamine kinase family protein [Stakelama saccharophila]|uniref:Fructosamine kinase family protein n=1 Tax=Stakelama saccharophila TaxID=3075605 RepID=A0ABZ0B7A3_9SPHN|nr:fructosamine kinase family protein [Stakelama sp. W311]WNO53102.1 fructosamine kinase family protein [Stakelama sp. W311]